MRICIKCNVRYRVAVGDEERVLIEVLVHDAKGAIAVAVPRQEFLGAGRNDVGKRSSKARANDDLVDVALLEAQPFGHASALEPVGR